MGRIIHRAVALRSRLLSKENKALDIAVGGRG